MKNNVWLTYKARIQAAQRLSSNDFHSQVLLVWYAFLSATLAIVTLRYDTLEFDIPLIAAVFSVGLLVLSMFVTSQDFRGRSISMRSNYIALQALHRDMSQDDPTTLEKAKYNELLAAVENHTSLDYRRFRVTYQGDLTRPPTRYEVFTVFMNRAFRGVMLVLLYTAPFSLLLAACI
ncbi:SLATT domain-containing protein [Alcaligenaceae bacterium]|nr:SLATT domain-containing protein [Alcaligenaceae bacterium]